MEMEKFYVAPEVEVLEVAVEKGFVASPGAGDGTGIPPMEGETEL